MKSLLLGQLGLPNPMRSKRGLISEVTGSVPEPASLTARDVKYMVSFGMEDIS